MRHVFEEARRTAGLTGENLVELLEMRLDALVLRAGFARTIQQARQFVVHRHIMVDGKIVDRPSFRVKPGQTLQVKPKSQTSVPFEIAAEGINQEALPATPDYLDVDIARLKATLVRGRRTLLALSVSSKTPRVSLGVLFFCRVVLSIHDSY